MNLWSRHAVLFSVLCCTATLGAEVTKESLKNAFDQNWGFIQDLEIRLEQTTAGTGTNGEEPIPFQSALLRSDGMHVLAREERPAGGIVLEQSYDFATSEGMRLDSAPALGRPHGYIHTDDSCATMLGVQWLTDLLRAPGVDVDQVARYGEYANLSGLLSSPNSRLRSETEIVNGRTAAVLDVFREAGSARPWFTVWLDLERNSVPLQWTLLNDLTGDIRFACRFSEYAEFDGAWLPLTVERYMGPGFPNSGLIAQRRVNMDDGVAQIHVNQGLTPADCTVQFPSGTLVMDVSGGEFYIARAERSLIPMQEAFAAARKALPIARRHDPASSWLGPSALALGLGFASVLITRYFVRS